MREAIASCFRSANSQSEAINEAARVAVVLQEAEILCGIYFEIAEAAIGEDAVRRLCDMAIEKRIKDS
ncbi:MAG: hypothetical protein DRP45_11820 [Candidatus Zixiibacteriota bacterium]|nr:MAG: hypothetical protein DRP45_11820 [candidate division Zixibacteria bacterium]